MTATASEFFYYVKGAAKAGAWKAIPVEDEARLNSPNVAFRTVLQVDQRVRPGAPPPDAETSLYQGPFYIDVDCEDSARKAISMARASVDALINVGIRQEDIYVWLSGSKGFHILVPQEAIAPPGPHKKLPLIYKFFAQGLKLDIDYRVYSTGRGRMWRVAGKKRDNDRYKVHISLQELREMKAADYDVMTRSPRAEPVMKPAVPCSAALARFERARIQANLIQNSAVFVEPEALKALEDEEYGLPPCGQLMLHGETREDVGFNDVSLQFAKVIATFGGANGPTLLKEFAQNAHGQTYNTPAAREDHCRRALSSAKNYKWSCKSALSVIGHDPCEGCPVVYLRNEQEDDAGRTQGAAPDPLDALPDIDDLDVSELPTFRIPTKLERAAAALNKPKVEPAKPKVGKTPEPAPKKGKNGNHSKLADSSQIERPKEPEAPVPEASDHHFDFANSQGLIADENGYGFLADKGKIRPICNFTIRIRRVYHEWVPAMMQFRRTSIMADVYLGSDKVGSTLIEESSWESKSSFLKCFSGLSNLGFFGKDDDVQKLRIVLMANVEKTAENVKRVHTYGIHHERVADEDVFTYVEPGWSIDSLGYENRYSMLGSNPPNAPELRFIEPVQKEEPGLRELVKAFLQLNEPKVAGQVMGWIMFCFYKNHVFAGWKREFPLLNVFGNAGSGKTQGMMKYGELFGTDYGRTADVTNAKNSSGFAVWQALSVSETGAVILDEYNLSKLGAKVYNDLGEKLKESYQRGAIARGVLSDQRAGKSAFGAELKNFTLCAPVAMCSEQGVTDLPALVSRTIQVPMKPKGLEWNDNAPRRAFKYIQQNWPLVQRFSKYLYLRALKTPIAEVKHVYDQWIDHVPLELGDRPQHGYTCVLAGLDILDAISEELGLNLHEEIQAAKNEVLSLFKAQELKQIVETKSRSEMDIVLDTMATMAASVSDESIRDTLKPDVHYRVAAGTLYLDIITAFAAFKRYMANVERKDSPISNIQSFRMLVQNEPYYVGERTLEGFARNTKAIGLSLAVMAEKGIETSAFLEDL